jgi:hypothetical protein
MDELVLDHLPDDPRHLIAVHVDDGVYDLDFLHEKFLTERKTATAL